MWSLPTIHIVATAIEVDGQNIGSGECYWTVNPYRRYAAVDFYSDVALPTRPESVVVTTRTLKETVYFHLSRPRLIPKPEHDPDYLPDNAVTYRRGWRRPPAAPHHPWKIEIVNDKD